MCAELTPVPYDPHKHRRSSIRLPGYDYSSAGAYFVTMCAQGRERRFATITRDGLQLSAAGQMLEWWWRKLPDKFPPVALDVTVIMPDHMHGIVWLQPSSPESVPLGTTIQWFKTMTTNAYIRGVREGDWPAFDRRLWQRDYYERIVRDEEALERIRAYIVANPARWIAAHGDLA
jgi:REP element-mobilizing transposase RayT